jgi:glycosyltransferase involved in cell wall biosynthesis
MITVLTPTYNRAYRLETLFKSLRAQTNREFEWVIVDDGSDDGTRELYDSWDKSSLRCSYFYKENGGKHTALNLGIQKAKGDYIFIVDSDDYLTEDAIETVLKWTEEIAAFKNYAGVAGLRGYDKQHPIGGWPKTSCVDCTNLERGKYHLLGDKAEIYKRELLLQYPFPEFAGEKYIPEDIVWNAIARDGYRLRWHNTIIYIGEYLPDGLTLGGREKEKDGRVNCFRGYTAREKLNVHVQTGSERYMELGRYIDLVKKVKGDRTCWRWTLEELNISAGVYVLGYLCYLGRKYGKMLRKKIG